MLKASLVFSILSFINATMAFGAEFSLVIDKKLNINTWERQRVVQFLQETERQVPAMMRQAIPRPIVINFEDFGDDSRTEIQAPICFNNLISPNSNPTEENAQPESQRYGFVKKPLWKTLADVDEVHINKLFLQEIFGGRDNSRAYACGHKNIYALAQATILHELGHIFDARYGFSDQLRFIKLMGFKSVWLWGDPENKNKQLVRSPDPYELASPKESFAVNLEFYLKDPEFSCRKPAVHRFYHDAFNGWDPFPKTQCILHRVVDVMDNLTGARLKVPVPPERIYSIEYLLASKGNGLESRFGHSMFRIVLCAPWRAVPGPECRSDLAYHIVVSYRANITDKKTSIRKGLMGGYPSKLFLFTFLSVMDEYNKRQLRDLKSLPLKLSQDEKMDFLDRLLEQVWSYEGDYKFLTLNCETESEDYLKAVFRDSKADDVSAFSPVGLYEELVKAGKLVDLSQKEDVFPAMADNVQRAFNRISTLSSQVGAKTFSDFPTFVKESTATSRQELYKELMKSATTRGLTADFYILELETAKFVQGQVRDKILEVVYRYDENPDALVKEKSPEIKARFLQLKAMKDQFAGLTATVSGYGVANDSDFRPDPFLEIQSLHTGEVYDALLESLVDQYAKAEHEESNKTRENILYFGKQVLELAKATKP